VPGTARLGSGAPCASALESVVDFWSRRAPSLALPRLASPRRNTAGSANGESGSSDDDDDDDDDDDEDDDDDDDA